MTFDWQDEIWQRLKERRERFPQALLMTGREGIGKRRLAERVARMLLCENPLPAGEPCGRCSACLWLAGGFHPDLRLVEPERNENREEGDGARKDKKPSHEITVAQIRDLADFVAMASHRGGAKVIVVQPAEALNASAANALLKTLEEPPPGTFFLLVSHRLRRLPATILSRCERMALPLPPPDMAATWLRSQGVADPTLSLAQTGGAPLAALELQDADYWRRRETFLRALAGGSPNPVLVAEKLQDAPFLQLVDWLQKWLYDLAACRLAGRLRYHPDFAAALRERAARLDPTAVLRLCRRLNEARANAHHPLHPKLAVEDLLIGYGKLLDSSR